MTVLILLPLVKWGEQVREPHLQLPDSKNALIQAPYNDALMLVPKLIAERMKWTQCKYLQGSR